MEFYTKTPPKSCDFCPLCRSGGIKIQKNGRYIEARQCVLGGYKYQSIDDEIDSCPLLSLEEHDNEIKLNLIKKVEDFFQERFRTRASSNIAATTIKKFLDELKEE